MEKKQYDVVVVGGGHNGLVGGGLPRPRRAVGARPRAARPHRRRRGVGEAFPGLERAALALLLPGLAAAGADRRATSASTSSCVSRPTASYTPVRARREARRPARRAPRGCGDARVVPGADRLRRGVRRLARVLRRRRRPGRTPSLRHCCRRCRTERGDPGAGGPGRLARPRRAPLGETIEERFTDDTVRGVVADRRADRHVRLAARPLAGAEPVLPLPPDRQRHRRVAGAGRRHGRA